LTHSNVTSEMSTNVLLSKTTLLCRFVTVFFKVSPVDLTFFQLPEGTSFYRVLSSSW